MIPGDSHVEGRLKKRNLWAFLLAGFLIPLACAGLAYARFIDWPSTGGTGQVRAYLPERFLAQDAHHYRYRNFMDTWELYRFRTTPEAIDYLAASLKLEPAGQVSNFPLIVSRPPPYWWHPEALPEATLYSSAERAPDGHLYDLLYAEESGIAYLIRFDG